MIRFCKFLLLTAMTLIARTGIASPVPTTLEALEFSVESALHGERSGDGPFDGDYPFMPFVTDTFTTFSGLRDARVGSIPNQHIFSGTFDATITSNNPYSSPFIDALLLPVTLVDRVYFQAFISSDGSYFEQLMFGSNGDASLLRANGDQVTSGYDVEYQVSAGGRGAGLYDITTLSSSLPDLLWSLSDFQSAAYFESYANTIYPADPTGPRLFMGEAFDSSVGTILRAQSTSRIPEPPLPLLIGVGALAVSWVRRRKADERR